MRGESFKVDIMAQFKKVLHPRSSDQLVVEEKILESMSPIFFDYYLVHWKRCEKMWATYARLELLIFGMDTNNCHLIE